MLFTLNDIKVDFVFNDAFVFTGISLEYGAGEVTKLKLSTDLKQRFSEVRHFLFHYN